MTHNNNILIITNIPAPYRISLFKYINQQCNSTVIYTDIDENGRRKWEIDYGTGYRYIAMQPKRMNITADINSLYREIKKTNLVLIGGIGLIHMRIAALISIILRRPYILWFDGGFVNNKESIWMYFYKKIYIRNASRYITTGRSGSKYLKHYGVDLRLVDRIILTGDTDILSHKCELFRKSKQFEITKKTWKLKKTVLCYVGSLEKSKGIDILLESYRKLCENHNDISLLIVGDGSLYNDIKSYIARYNLNDIVLTGFQQHNRIYKYYAVADIFIFPTRNDIWGYVINEAMSCRLPVITTNMAGAAYELVVDGYNGFIIKPSDMNALINKVNYLINSNQMKEFGKRSYEIIKDTNNKSVAHRYVEVFNKIK